MSKLHYNLIDYRGKTYNMRPLDPVNAVICWLGLGVGQYST